MSSVTFSTAVGGDGSTVTDDNNATTGLREGGWKTRFVPCFTQQVAVANYVVTKASEASTSASAAAQSAINATNNGAAQVTLAAAQVTLATAQANAAAASYDSFDDRYLGSKTSDPSVDNDGNALITGALYWNSSSSVMKVYNGGAWSVAYVSASSTGASIRPSLLLDFANSKTLDPRITFTRASTATYTGYDGLIKIATSGFPRFDHNPTTGESLGLLIEEARTNLLTYSEQFDNATWTKSNATVTANATLAPDGTVTADKVIITTGNSAGYPYIVPIFSANTTYTLSAYMKAAERTEVRLNVYTAEITDVNVKFDLVNGTVLATAGSPDSYSIQSVGNGWYRCSITKTMSATVTSPQLQVARVQSVTGDGTSGIFIWGAQLEAGSFATSYIPTVASQATRAADNAVMTGTNFSSWYRQDEGTVFVKQSLLGLVPTGTSASPRITNNTLTDRIEIRFGVVIAGSDATVIKEGVAQVDTGQFLIVADTPVNQAYAYKTNDFAFTQNGESPLMDSSMIIPLVDRLSLAEGVHSSRIAKLAYYPKRLTNAELQSITTV